MKRLILGLILLLCCGSCWAGALSGYSNYFTVTINHGEVSSDTTDYDLVIFENSLPSGFWSKVLSDGSDIALTVDGSTKLSRDLVLFNTSTQKMQLIVKVPSVSTTANTVIYFCYNKTTGGDSNSTDTYANTKFYLPMENANDRTSNAINFTVNGATSGQTGKAGGCYSFDGVNDNFSTSYSSAIVNSGSAFTFSAWINLTDFNNIYPHILNAKANTTYSLQFGVSNRNDAFPDVYLGSNMGSATSWSKISSQSPASTFTGNWVYYTVSYNGSGSTTNGNFKIYENGTLKTNYATGNFGTDTNTTYIGGYVSNQWFKGKIDEPKLMTTQLSDGVVALKYKNYNTPTTLYTVGSEQSATSSIIPQAQYYYNLLRSNNQ